MIVLAPLYLWRELAFGVSLLDWQSFDHAVNVGHQLAAKRPAAMSREELAPYRGA